LVDWFIEKYYEGFDRPYHPGTEEYTNILRLFESIANDNT